MFEIIVNLNIAPPTALLDFMSSQQKKISKSLKSRTMVRLGEKRVDNNIAKIVMVGGAREPGAIVGFHIIILFRLFYVEPSWWHVTRGGNWVVIKETYRPERNMDGDRRLISRYRRDEMPRTKALVFRAIVNCLD